MRDGPPYHHGRMHILVVEDEGKVAPAIKEGRERQRHRRPHRAAESFDVKLIQTVRGVGFIIKEAEA